MTAYAMPEIAAKLYALSLALDDPQCENPTYLIRQGQLLVQAAQERGRILPPGRESIYYRDAGAAFMRSWAAHEPERAADILDAAEALELFNKLDLFVPSPEAA